MAENNIPQVTPFINDHSSMEIGRTPTGQPAVRSDVVARHFQKKHKHVLEEIRKLIANTPKSFHGPNFRPMFTTVKIGNGATRQEPAYLLTRDAFSLLAMGFTGKQALAWKLRYIEAFNALEQAQLERERVALENAEEWAREAGYLEGRQEALSLPVMEIERKKGYLAGLTEGRKCRKAADGLRLLKKIASYRQKGLTCREIATLLDLPKSTVHNRIKDGARLAGIFGAPASEAVQEVSL